jgi:predicted permease
MAEEFRHHLDLRTEDLIRRGLAPEEAARRARIEFGHIESHKHSARVSRGLWLFDEVRFSALDIKLGVRMLMKYPGLSVVSVIGMSVAIGIGAGGFGVIDSTLDPTLPLPQGERLVSVTTNARPLHDFVEWREQVESIEDLGAFETDRRNLIIPDHGVTLVRVAEMTASGFRVTRTPPALGRPLLDEDEREDAPPVLVIAYEEWQRRFDGDPAIIGRQVRLGTEVHTVVGVMPAGYRFPITDTYWVPLKLDPNDYERGEGPWLAMFGRLADGVTLDQAQAELTTLGLRSAAAYPDTHARFRPRVMRYTRPFMDLDSPALVLALRAVQLAIGLLLIVVAVNVAILVYARTVMRTGEIAVRTALGASRRRIIAQLFAEALVLSGTAAAIGLTIAGMALAKTQTIAGEMMGDSGDISSSLPFWWEADLSASVVAYVVALAVLAAVVVGVLPALKATGRGVHASLQQLSSRGSGMQLGRTWTALIVAQVAVVVAVLPFAGWVAGESLRRAAVTPVYPADQILRAWMGMGKLVIPPGADPSEYEQTYKARFLDPAAEVLRRLEAEPAVAGVTFGRVFSDGPVEQIEADGGETHRTIVSRVDVDYFSVFDVPILVGRGFVDADIGEGSNGVVINRLFAERVFGNANVVGRRIRRVSANAAGAPGSLKRGPWLEIIGVVPDFMAPVDLAPPRPRLFEPVALADVATGIRLSVRIAGPSAPAFAARLREITADVDPALQLHELMTAAEEERQTGRILYYIALGVTLVVLSVVLLSAAGIYAMMSFTVARRRREIAIRSALGADPRRLLRDIFARASAQLGAGVLVGLLLAALVRGLVQGMGLILLPLVAALMMVVGLIAALGPARRGLAVQPTEALREE